jgi:hypothetical protein
MPAFALFALLLMTSPTGASEVGEHFFRREFGSATLAAECGLVSGTESTRLRTAVMRGYLSPNSTWRVARPRLDAIANETEAIRATGPDCVAALRTLLSLLEAHPPAGARAAPLSPLQGWPAGAFHRHAVHSFIALRALKCGAITQAEAASLIARSATQPLIAFHLTPAQAIAATDVAQTRLAPLARHCGLAADMADALSAQLDEEDTGWREPPEP